MSVENPEVALEVDGNGFPEEARETVMIEWACVFTVHGDDGRHIGLNAI